MLPITTPELLREAVTTPTWVDVAGFTLEKIHTNTLARALATRTVAANRLAAALWERASDEALDAKDITITKVEPERRLGHGAGTKVDLYVEFTVGGAAKVLAFEVKVDGAPDGRQLETEAKSLGVGPHRRLVLLTLGSTQVCRLVGENKIANEVPRWTVRELVEHEVAIIAASPSDEIAREWMKELHCEDARRRLACESDSKLHGCGYRDRLLETYRYALVAHELKSHGCAWNVAVLPFGVVLSEFPSWKRVPFGGTEVTVYLEVIDKVLRVKAGAWAKPVNPREATKAVAPLIRDAFVKHDFKVESARQTSGSSVTIFSIDSHDLDWSIEAMVPRLKRAFTAWKSVSWPT